MTATDVIVYGLAVIGALVVALIALGLLGVLIFRAPQRPTVIDLRESQPSNVRVLGTLTTDPSSVSRTELTRRIEERSREQHPTGRGDAS